MHQVDPYQVLGVSSDANSEQIKAAYRTWAKKLHPDVNPGHDAAEKFKLITAAYNLLNDPEAKAAWDQEEAARKEEAAQREARARFQAEQQAAEQAASERPAFGTGWETKATDTLEVLLSQGLHMGETLERVIKTSPVGRARKAARQDRIQDLEHELGMAPCADPTCPTCGATGKNRSW